MKVLVCGGRDFMPRSYVEETLDELAGVLRVETVIDGGAAGVDRWAYEWALQRGVNTETYLARWKEVGRAAGLSRNRRMLHEGQPNLVVAFPGPKSRGTWHMVKIARESGLPVWVMPYDRSQIAAFEEG